MSEHDAQAPPGAAKAAERPAKADGAPAAGKAEPKRDGALSKAITVLSALALTPESALKGFRERRVPDSNLDVEDLGRARNILSVLATVVTSATPGGPELIARMWELCQERDKPATGAAVAPPSSAVPSSKAQPTSERLPEQPALIGAPAPLSPPPARGADTPESRPLDPPLPAFSSPAPPPVIHAPPPPVVAPSSVRSASESASPWLSTVPSPPPVARSSDLGLVGPAGRPDSNPSVWATRPPDPPPAVPASEPKPAIDFAALNRIKLDEGSPGTIGISAAVAFGPALPFRGGDAEAPADESAPSRPGGSTPFRSAAKEEGARSDQSAAEAARPATPFRTMMQKAIDPALLPVPPSAVPPEPPVAPLPAPTSNRTPTSAPAAPAAPPASGSPPELALEQCAALFAECAAFPQNNPAIWARYKLDERSFRALEQVWRARFSSDPALSARWRALYEHYRTWYVARGSGGA